MFGFDEPETAEDKAPQIGRKLNSVPSKLSEANRRMRFCLVELEKYAHDSPERDYWRTEVEAARVILRKYAP